MPFVFKTYFYASKYQCRGNLKRYGINSKIIASICVGALPVGKSGILKDKKGTTYNSAIRREALQGFGVNVINQAIVMDDNIITSWNPSTAMNVALLLLEQLTSTNNAGHIRQLMGF